MTSGDWMAMAVLAYASVGLDRAARAAEKPSVGLDRAAHAAEKPRYKTDGLIVELGSGPSYGASVGVRAAYSLEIATDLKLEPYLAGGAAYFGRMLDGQTLWQPSIGAGLANVAGGDHALVMAIGVAPGAHQQKVEPRLATDSNGNTFVDPHTLDRTIYAFVFGAGYRYMHAMGITGRAILEFTYLLQEPWSGPGLGGNRFGLSGSLGLGYKFW
jgi:hypothetical protein